MSLDPNKIQGWPSNCRASANVKTPILVIDNDLSFAFWLTKALDCAGYEAFPAKSVQDASILLTEIPMKLGLLVLVGNPADSHPFTAQVRRQHKDLRILCLLEEEEAGEPTFCVDSHLRKPAGRTEQELVEIFAVIERMFASEPVTF